MDTPIDWDQIEKLYPVGSMVKGIVILHRNYGIYVDIGHPQVIAHIPGPDFVVAPEIYVKQHIILPFPPIGSEVEAKVTAYKKKDGNEVWLTMKPLKSK